MEQKRKRRTAAERGISENATEGEKLDALNQEVRRQRNPSNAIRRQLEAQLEARSKRRRSQQAPASGRLGGCA